jgi:glycosyltransferase involved in cell wall biosynthesis
MRIVLLTPGTGDFHCGSCIRDNTLVRGLRDLGHDAVLVPLYLPFLVDEDDMSRGAPILLGGINMYLQQVFRVFRRTPRWLDRIFDWRPLLGIAARRAAMTKPAALGAITVSTLLGESGRQAKEVDRLATWIGETGAPDVVCISNVLLVGVARQIRERLRAVAVVSTLQGEDGFLDALPEPDRARAWEIVSERTRELDAVIPVSRTYGEVMTGRLGLDPARVHPVLNGLRLDGYEPALEAPDPPAIGYLARMTEAKGLSTLVDAFLALARMDRVPGVRLRIAGSRTPADRRFTRDLEKRIAAAGLADRVEWLPNVSREEKLAFLRGLSVLSVPATCGEAFGLYVIEALASGVPVVQPRHGAFPELIEATGGGVLCEPDDADDLARTLGELLLDPDRCRALGAKGRAAVLDRFTDRNMAEGVLEVFGTLGSPA